MHGIGREIASGERAELSAFISRRHERRERDEGERATEDLWRESSRRENARRRREARAGWYGHHMRMSELHARISAEHAEKAEKLCEDDTKGAA